MISRFRSGRRLLRGGGSLTGGVTGEVDVGILNESVPKTKDQLSSETLDAPPPPPPKHSTRARTTTTHRSCYHSGCLSIYIQRAGLR